MLRKPYIFSEDTELILDVAKLIKGKRCIELGCGNCYVLEELTKKFDLAIGTDLVMPSRLKKDTEFVITDLASCFRDEVFDFAFANPPYLPSDEIIDLAVDSGKDSSVTVRFVEEALRVLKIGGKLYILLSSLSDIDKVLDFAFSAGCKIKKIKERRLFFESLLVYEIEKSC